MSMNPTAQDAAARSPLYRSLFFQLIVAIVAGIVVGALAPSFGAGLKPIADTFINLIKMSVAPIIFFTVVIGIGHVGDLRSVGRIGLKALIYFEVVTTFACCSTGYSFNLDSATRYLSICFLFLAQALNADLTLGEQITAVLVLMLTSKGMAGVPGSSFLALSATVAAVGHGAVPVAAVALLLGTDRIMDSMRVSVNLTGNCVATFVVANWEGQLDKERMRAVLDGEPEPEAEPAPVELQTAGQGNRD